MADWTNIDVNSLLPGQPFTSAIALAYEENPRAIAEGAAGAPKVDPINAMQHQGQSGAVGTYVFATTGNVDLSFGQLINGSGLTPVSANGVASGSLFGTWRCMGNTGGVSSEQSSTLFLRIS